MNISSLSIQSKRRLSKLLEELTDVLNEKDSLIESASKEVDRMNEALDMQNRLDEKGSEFTNIATPIEAKELQDLVIKSDRLSSEIEDINLKSRELNDELEELSEKEKTLVDQINSIVLKKESNIEQINKGIYVSELSTDVYIVDAQIPEIIDPISKENCEIINCNINLISEISKLYNSNINKIVTEIDNNEDFIELKEKVEKYKEDKNNSYDKQLEMLKKSFENAPLEEEKEEPTETPIEIKEEIEVPKEEEKVVLNNDVKVDPIDQILSLQSVIDSSSSPEVTEDKVQVDSLETLQNINSDNTEASKEEPTKENIVYINSDDKVVPNQIARATKDKLNNKIIKIFEGSYPETKIEFIPSISNNNDTTFNLENFINNKTA